MNDHISGITKKVGMATNASFLVIVWTLSVGMSLAWNIFTLRKDAIEQACDHARVAFQKDVTYRKWNAMHGGVYAPVTQATPPNPYLDVPEKTIRTTSGRELTMINPAYMTRQIHELEQKATGIQGHITSLNLIRPENVADEWETQALKRFLGGEKEVSSVELFRGESHMRFMAPLIAEKSCLACHAAQGYKEGEIRGGISISIPMESEWALFRRRTFPVGLGHAVLWILGMVGIVIFLRNLRLQMHEHDLIHDRMLDLENRKKIDLESLNAELRIANQRLSEEENKLKKINIGLEQIVQERTLQIVKEKALLENKVRERTRELEAKAAEIRDSVDELQQMNTMMTGREIKMIEMKKRINELSKALGMPGPYDV